MSIRISRVYTGTGDKGQTRLASGGRAGKDDIRIEAYGTVDELGAVIGVLAEQLRLEPASDGQAQQLSCLRRIQNELFDVGSELAFDGDIGERPVVTEEDVKRLEAEIDAANEGLSRLNSFVLAGGGMSGALFHQARTVSRRAERRAVELSRSAPQRSELMRYLNRLSDLFFVMGRAAAARLGEEEVLWRPGDRR